MALRSVWQGTSEGDKVGSMLFVALIQVAMPVRTPYVVCGWIEEENQSQERRRKEERETKRKGEKRGPREQ